LARAEISSGVCGFTTVVEAAADGKGRVLLTIESDCKAVQCLAEELSEVDALQEITFRGTGPLTMQMAAKHLRHAACPVPAGIVKTVEVAAGLALPVDVTIKLSSNS